jgi:hypothetical protein
MFFTVFYIFLLLFFSRFRLSLIINCLLQIVFLFFFMECIFLTFSISFTSPAFLNTSFTLCFVTPIFYVGNYFVIHNCESFCSILAVVKGWESVLFAWNLLDIQFCSVHALVKLRKMVVPLFW